MTIDTGIEKKLAVVDLFEQNSMLIFPHSEGGWHCFFFIDPVTLNQAFYDSLNEQMASSKYCDHVSKCIHCWVIDYHKHRKCADNPKCNLEWRLDLVEDNQQMLGNNRQIGNDCVLHAIVLPVLIQKQ